MEQKQAENYHELLDALEEAVTMFIGTRFGSTKEISAFEPVADTAAIADITAWGMKEEKPEEACRLLQAMRTVVEIVDEEYKVPLADVVSGTQYWSEDRARTRLRSLAE